MKPPKCAVCDKNFRNSNDKFKLLRFALSEEDRLHNEKMKEEGKTGHPRGTAWFCETHYPLAKKYTKCTIAEALEYLQE